MFSESEIGVEEVDYEELGLYLALTMEAKDMKKLGITEVCPERKSNRGRPPTITSSGSEEVKEKRLKPWNPPRKKPDEFTKNTMLTEALRIALKVVMKNHVYLFDNEIRKQSKGGAIGLRLTGILAQTFMMWWDREFSRRLLQVGVIQRLNERYVDDINIAAEATTPGLKYKNGQSCVDQSMIREEERVEDDERTMKFIKQVGDDIHHSIELEIDYPSKHVDKKLPILDMKVWIEDQEK
jgi:hypothetical protein